VRWFPLALLLCASFADAQSDANQKTARVEGTVLSSNGDLIRKATVRLQGTASQPGQQPASYNETTDNMGKFVFDDVTPGRYTLSADKPGFAAGRYGARSNASPGTQFNLTAGMEMKDLVIKMTPQGVIAGKVLDQDGDPVVSVQVQAMRSTYIGGRKQLQPTGGTTTNDLGEYRLINLVPGRYFISASDSRAVRIAQDSDLRVGKGQEASIPTYYPNSADVTGALAVDVAAGAEMRGTDIRLLKARVYIVRGKALDAPSTAPAILVLTRKDDSTNLPAMLNGGGSTQTRPDGTFEFRNVLPGTYVLQLTQVISVNGNTPADMTGRVEVTVGNANVDNLVLPLVPRPSITGTVTLEDGDVATLLKPAQNATGGAINGTPVIARWQIGLFQMENGPALPNAQVNADGTFRFNSVSLGKYSLNALSLTQRTYLKSARFGGQDVLHGYIDTTSGTGGTLDLVYSSKVATITGSVHNEKGEASAGIMVTLWPKIPDTNPIGMVRPGITDQNGGFKFQGLAPGDYYVAAWEDVDQGLLQSAEFVGHFTSDASAIKLSEGGQESRDLKLIPADKTAVEIAKLQ